MTQGQPQPHHNLITTITSQLSQATHEQAILAALFPLAQALNASYLCLKYIDAGQNFYAANIAACLAHDGTPVSITQPHRTSHEYPFLRIICQHPDTPLCVENAFADPLTAAPEIRNLFRSIGQTALIALPCHLAGQWHGAVVFTWETPQTFTDEIRALCTSLQPIIAGVVATRRAHLAQQAISQQAQRLDALIQGLHTVQTDHEVLQLVAQPALEHGATNAILHYLTQDNLYQPAWRVGATLHPTRHRIPDLSWLTHTHLLTDVATAEGIPEPVRHHYVDANIRGLAIIPLRQSAQGLGVLTFTWTTPHIFSAQEQTYYHQLAPLITPTVANLRLRRELARLYSEKSLDTLLHSTEAAISLRDTTGKYLLINQQMAALLRRNPAEVIGQTAEAFLPPDLASVCHAADKEVLTTQALLQYEEEFVVHGQTTRFNVQNFPLLDGQGNVAAICTLVFEITAFAHNGHHGVKSSHHIVTS